MIQRQNPVPAAAWGPIDTLRDRGLIALITDQSTAAYGLLAAASGALLVADAVFLRRYRKTLVPWILFGLSLSLLALLVLKISYGLAYVLVAKITLPILRAAYGWWLSFTCRLP